MKKRINNKVNDVIGRVRMLFVDKTGDGALNITVVVLVSVVLGALILSGLYAILKDTVLPTLKTKIVQMFSFSG